MLQAFRNFDREVSWRDAVAKAAYMYLECTYSQLSQPLALPLAITICVVRGVAHRTSHRASHTVSFLCSVPLRASLHVLNVL